MLELELLDEVVDWLDTLSQQDHDRVVVFVDRLAEPGSSARMPFSRSLGRGLFELRFTLGSSAQRLTYRFTSDGRIILLTVFRKKRDNEHREIARARVVAKIDQAEHP